MKEFVFIAYFNQFLLLHGKQEKQKSFCEFQTLIIHALKGFKEEWNGFENKTKYPTKRSAFIKRRKIDDK